MIAELLAPSAPAWTVFLAAVRHDFYHLPAYVELEAGRLGGQALALHVIEGARALLLPLVVRPIPGGGSDAVSPYGYPGPLVKGTDDPSFAGDALTAAMPELRAAGLVTLFIRLHPILDDPPPDRPGSLVPHGETVVIDLATTDEMHWAQTRSGHRSQIRRAERLGHLVRLDAGSERFADFRRLYAATMDRVGADDAYRFSDEYFDRLRDALGERLHLGVVLIGGAVAAAALFTETCGIVQYHLAAAADAFLREGPNKLLVHHGRGWAKRRGDRFLHLGGGVGSADDSLFRFKAGFSPLRRRFHTWRIVVDETEYRRLIRLRAPGADAADRSGFFPAYRRPGPDTPDGAGTSPSPGATDR